MSVFVRIMKQYAPFRAVRLDRKEVRILPLLIHAKRYSKTRSRSAIISSISCWRV